MVKIKALRPIVMAVMKHLSHVDEKYLKVLVNLHALTNLMCIKHNVQYHISYYQVKDKELYDDCDTVVKRQMWKGLFA